jgi:hypothetical protein
MEGGIMVKIGILHNADWIVIGETDRIVYDHVREFEEIHADNVDDPIIYAFVFEEFLGNFTVHMTPETFRSLYEMIGGTMISRTMFDKLKKKEITFKKEPLPESDLLEGSDEEEQRGEETGEAS